MCTVGVYKCVCVCPMCVLSVAISDSVSCVVCWMLCAVPRPCFTVHNVRVYILLCCFVVTCVLASVVSCESRHIIVYCV